MWDHDYCTVCDKLCPMGSIFCSEQCRHSEESRSSSPCPSSSSAAPFQTMRPALSLSPLSTSPFNKTPSEYFSLYSTSSPSRSASSSPASSTSTTTTTNASKEFMYASPLLLPQQSSSPSTRSPPPSPIMMPVSQHGCFVKNTKSFSADQNYRKWLTAV